MKKVYNLGARSLFLSILGILSYAYIFKLNYFKLKNPTVMFLQLFFAITFQFSILANMFALKVVEGT